MKYIIVQISAKPGEIDVGEAYISIFDNVNVTGYDSFTFSLVGINTSEELRQAIVAAALEYAEDHEHEITEADVLWPPFPTTELQQRSIKLYSAGELQTGIKIAMKSAVVADGQAVFHLTDDGTEEGDALFEEVFNPGGVVVLTNNTDVSFTWDIDSISPDQKTLTLNVNKLAVSLGIMTLNTPANGETVSVIVFGK